MKSFIRKITSADKSQVLEMMREFYSSPAVLTNGSEEIFSKDLDACINENPYLEGYVFEKDGVFWGYAMVAKSFSAEFGMPCIWIEDLYLRQEHRNKGIGRTFIEYVTETHRDCIFRLEVEDDNKKAIKLYESQGFEILPYTEMIKLR